MQTTAEKSWFAQRNFSGLLQKLQLIKTLFILSLELHLLVAVINIPHPWYSLIYILLIPLLTKPEGPGYLFRYWWNSLFKFEFESKSEFFYQLVAEASSNSSASITLLAGFSLTIRSLSLHALTLQWALSRYRLGCFHSQRESLSLRVTGWNCQSLRSQTIP